MKKIKLLALPLLTLPFVIGCNNGGGDKPEDVKFSLSSDQPIKVDGEGAIVYVDWTPTEHSIKFDSFTFTTEQSEVDTVDFDKESEARPMPVTITFKTAIIEDISGTLSFGYEDVTAKTKKESSLTFTIPAPVDPEHHIPEKLTKIEDGLYSMTFRDDFVEDYISKGGGSNDGAILDYAKNNISDDEILDLYEPIEGRGACSSFNCLSNEEDYIHCRNLDLLPPKIHSTYPSIIMHNIPKKGYESIAFSSFANMGMRFTINDADPFEHEQAFKIFEFIPVDGINSEGLAVNINDISNEHSRVNQTEESKINITTTVLVRRLLNEAKNVEEAIEIINNFNIHDSTTRNTAYHIMISDANGDSCVVEFYDNVIQRISKGAEDKILTMTNTEMNSHFPQEEGQGSWKDCPRYKAIIEKFSEYRENLTQENAIEVLKAATQETTTHSIVYNLQKKSVYFCCSQQWNKMHFYEL